MPVRVEVTLADTTTAVQAPDEDGVVWRLSLRPRVGEVAASVEEVQRATSGAAEEAAVVGRLEGPHAGTRPKPRRVGLLASTAKA